MYVPILKFIDIIVLEIFDVKLWNSRPLCLATGVAMETILCSTRWGVFLMLAYNYELDTTTQYWVITIFNWIRYVTLWPWPFTFWPSSHVTWCHFGGRSVYQVWTGYVPKLERLQFSIDRQLKVPIFTFFWRKRGQISNLIFLTLERHYLGGNDV